MKLLAFDAGVNVTLGLPIIRTSVDHGTAFDIAWKGVAFRIPHARPRLRPQTVHLDPFCLLQTSQGTISRRQFGSGAVR